jgi:hypothetical protein
MSDVWQFNMFTCINTFTCGAGTSRILVGLVACRGLVEERERIGFSNDQIKLRASFRSRQRKHSSDRQAGLPFQPCEDTFAPTADIVGGSLRHGSVSPVWRTWQLGF